MNEKELWLYSLCKKNGVSITDIQIRRLSAFNQSLLDWNKKINLVSRKNEEGIWKDHIALSISLLFKLTFRSGMRILDLGTGGGFPGIPLAIMLPACTFTLLDSTQKKIMAVQSMADSVGLSNVGAVWGRAEELHKNAIFSRAFDVVLARSVSNLNNLLDWGMPFLKRVRGENIFSEKVSIAVPSLITFKGMEIEAEEQTAQKRFPGVFLKSIPLIFPGSEEFDNLEKKIIIATFK